MTVEKLYAKKFNSFIEELNTDKEKNQKMLSEVDKQLSDCLHFLENEKTNEVILTKIGEKICELRKVRRQIKNNLIDINNVLNKFKSTKKMNEVSECEYNYRTEVIFEILSK